MSMIGQIMAHFRIASTAPPDVGMSVESDVYGHLGSTLREMEEQIKKLELPLSLTHFERMKAAFDSDERKHALSPDWLTHNLAELTTRIIDELEQRLFLNVPVHQAP